MDFKLLDRLASKFEINPETGCWVWTAAKHRTGYGSVWSAGQMQRAHRVCYEATVEPIPEGLEIDHLCRNRDCINPDHLEPVTQKENIGRGVPWRPRPTHCPNGHEYTPENTGVHKNSIRCRTCDKGYQERRRATGKGSQSSCVGPPDRSLPPASRTSPGQSPGTAHRYPEPASPPLAGAAASPGSECTR